MHATNVSNLIGIQIKRRCCATNVSNCWNLDEAEM